MATPSYGSPARIATLVLLLTLGVNWRITPFAEAIAQDFLSFTFYSLYKFLLPTEQPTNNNAYFIVQPLQVRAHTPSDTFLGGVIVFDVPMTVRPDESSLEIGRGRGMYPFDNNSTLGAGIEFLWTAEFNDASGYGAGSTLTFKGFENILLPMREIAIVGGTGKFRLARGWLEITTLSQGSAFALLNFTANVYYGFW